MPRSFTVNRQPGRRSFLRAPLCLLLAAGALAFASAPAGAATFEWEGVAAGVTNPGLIATDGAGRVLVPLRGQGKVAMYDNRRGGNAFLRNVGDGVLVDPYAVAVDDREDIYVADRGLNAVVVFDALVNNSGQRKVNGTLGAALGQFNQPSGIAVDSLTRAYVTEPGNPNLRVQVLEVAGLELRELFAFGVTQGVQMTQPDGVAVDAAGQYFVSDAQNSGVVVLYSPQGVEIGPVVANGSGSGQVRTPRGLTVDPAGRLIVADSGNNRISQYNSQAAGFGHLGSFGTLGGGTGQFNGPASVALAPGAMLYVTDAANNRIVRLRYDDADHDDAIDAVDTCPGVPDPHQHDHDGDGAGDECDLDDDGDGLPDSLDPCPITLPVVDANGDGCADPISATTSPARGSRLSARPSSVAGTATADVLGVKRVQVAVLRRVGARCQWLDRNARLLRYGACNRPRYFSARGADRWRASLRNVKLPRGRYFVYSRAVQKRSGMRERARVVKTTFTVFGR